MGLPKECVPISDQSSVEYSKIFPSKCPIAIVDEVDVADTDITSVCKRQKTLKMIELPQICDFPTDKNIQTERS